MDMITYLNCKCDDTDASFELKLEEGKKASHIAGSTEEFSKSLLQSSSGSVTLECSGSWVFGGLEINSHARAIEAYAVDKAQKQTYISTGRGSLINDNVYSTVVLSPGGPRPVVKVKLKLFSREKPTEETSQAIPISIFFLKVKGRILPPEPLQQANMFAPPQQIFAPPQQMSPSYTDNTTATIHAMAMMMQSMEKRICQSFDSLNHRITSLEHQINNLQTHITCSHKASVDHRIQLLQLQNQFLVEKMQEISARQAEKQNCAATQQEKEPNELLCNVMDHAIDIFQDNLNSNYPSDVSEIPFQHVAKHTNREFQKSDCTDHDQPCSQVLSSTENTNTSIHSDTSETNSTEPILLEVTTINYDPQNI